MVGLSDDDEVEEVSKPVEAVKELRQQVEDGVEVVGSRGSTLAADLPHPRADCPVSPFTPSKTAKRAVRGNDKHCPSCWCFVCEVPVAQCPQWSSRDAKTPAHCNAHAKNKLWAGIKAELVRR